MDVICDGCGQIFHETTDKFDPSRPSKGHCFRLKDSYRLAGWSSFAENEDTEYGTLECPGCNVPYGNGSGFVTTKEEDGTVIRSHEYAERYVPGADPLKCERCNKAFKSKSGLVSHQRSCDK